MQKRIQLPELPFDKWKETRITLHLILQIIGKVRLKMTPRKNHWWYITHYISVHGFSTSPIPCEDGINTFEIVYDVHQREVRIQTSFAQKLAIPLHGGLTVARFYQKFTNALASLNITPAIIDKPFDMGVAKRFPEIVEYHHFDWDYINRFWQIMLWTDGVFKEFSGRSYGKTCPVQLYWHHLDLAVTRFSGKKAPPLDASARLSDKDAYSHEAISFGFWAGDENMQEPAYYSYTYPSPDGLESQPIKPEAAKWIDSNGSPMAILRYHDLIRSDDPRAVLLDFLESTYQAGATLSGWDLQDLKVQDLGDL